MLRCSFLDGFLHGNRSLFGLRTWTAFDILYTCMCNLFIAGAGWCGCAPLWRGMGLGTRRRTFNGASRWKKVFTSLLSSVWCVSRGRFHSCSVSQTVWLWLKLMVKSSCNSRLALCCRDIYQTAWLMWGGIISLITAYQLHVCSANIRFLLFHITAAFLVVLFTTWKILFLYVSF